MLLPVFEGDSDRNGNWVNCWPNSLWADDVAGLSAAGASAVDLTGWGVATREGLVKRSSMLGRRKGNDVRGVAVVPSVMVTACMVKAA